MYIQRKFYVSFSKLDLAKLTTNFFSTVATLLLITSVVSWPITKKLFLRLSECLDELLSAPKMTMFRANL